MLPCSAVAVAAPAAREHWTTGRGTLALWSIRHGSLALRLPMLRGWPSRDGTVNHYLKKWRSRLLRRIVFPVAAIKMFQFPSPPMFQGLFEAVSGTDHRTGRRRPRLTGPKEENHSVDVSLAMAHHLCHESGRLEYCQPLFGNACVQTTISLIDRDRGIHRFEHT
jgi:hypothetical protein